MSTKPQSSLYIIIIIAILIFITASIWKFTKPDNSEEVYVEPMKETIQNVVAKEVNIVDDEIKPLTKIETVESEFVETEDKSLDKLHTTLNLNLMFKDPESLVKAIDHYESIGDNSKAKIYIDFLRERFPDYNY